MMKLRSQKTKVFIGLLGLFFVLGLAASLYVQDYYRASDYVQELVQEYGTRLQRDGSYTTINPNRQVEGQVGLIFYPGGKVEAQAYLPLLLALADQGVKTVLVEMPFNLAVLDSDAADRVFAIHSDIQNWYIGGIPWAELWQANI